MRIAVIVPAFNVAPFLSEAIESVRNQTHRDWMLVIVNDGSTDDTPIIASSIQDDRTHVLHQPKAGVSAARNRGIRFAEQLSPDAYLFLDGDDRLALDALTALSETLDNAPWAAAACARYARFNGHTLPRLSTAPPSGCVLERIMTRNLFANGGHLLIRREAIAAAGEFRQDLTFGEDWEYWTRIALVGEFAAVAAPAPLLFVRERPGSATQFNAASPDAYRPAMEAILRNPGLADRLGKTRLEHLQRRAEAETAWSIGRELIRHGKRRDGQLWLGRSLRSAPSVKRLALIALSYLRSGPFRPYRTVV